MVALNFKEMILQQFQTEIQGFLTKLSALKAPRGRPSKVANLPIMANGDVEYLNNQKLRN